MDESGLGFSLIDLVLVLVIVGLLSAVAIPRYIEVSGEREYSLKRNIDSTVKNALVIARADTNEFPSVAKLASYVKRGKVSAVESGIVLQHKKATFTVPTYVDNNCMHRTKSVKDTVKCVGSIP